MGRSINKGMVYLLFLLSAVACSTASSIKKIDLNQPLTDKYLKAESTLIEQADLLQNELIQRGLVLEKQQEYGFFYSIASQITPSKFKENKGINFNILKNPTANAFALPNGSVYVNEGLIAVLENEAQLAAVLAHELAHVTQRHGLKSHINRKNTVIAAHLANFALMGTDLIYFPALASLSSYSRRMEAEADHLSIAYLHKSGFPVGAGIETFKIFQSLPEHAAIRNSIYGTHPDNKARIEKIAELIKSAHPESIPVPSYQASKAFLIGKQSALLSSIEYRLLQHHYLLAIDLIDRYLNVFEPNATIFHLRGEALRLMAQHPDKAARKDAELKGKAKPDKALLRQYQDKANKNMEKAYAAFNQSISLDQNYSLNYRSIGLLEKHQGQTLAALDNLNHYLELSPQTSDRLYIERIISDLKE